MTWLQVLRTTFPEYDELKYILDNGPKIVASISPKGKSWYMSLVSENNEYELPVTSNYSDKISWTCNQLRSWKNVKQISYDTWSFEKKRDAEKFQTLFNLSCP